jgi:excisionase family DNA binding protein
LYLAGGRKRPDDAYGRLPRPRRFRKISAPSQPQRLRQVLANLHRTLEEFETALVEFEEALGGESTIRPDGRKGLNLLSIPEVCQELGMGKSWVYRRIQSGEIPSVKLGHNIKVRREDLERYLEAQRHRPRGEGSPPGKE